MRFYFLSFALLSRLRFKAFPRTYDLPSRHDLPTAFLNRPSIQLNIHTTENCANTELGWGWGFMAFSLTAQPFQVRSSSMNLRPSFKKRPSHSPSSIGRASNWTYTRLRITRTLNWAEGEVFDVFPRTAQPIQVRSSSTNIRPPYSLPQLAEHPIEHTHDWELREHWIRPRVRFYTFSLTLLSRFKFGALPQTYDLPTTLLN